MVAHFGTVCLTGLSKWCIVWFSYCAWKCWFSFVRGSPRYSLSVIILLRISYGFDTNSCPHSFMWWIRYENSRMSDDQISELVTETLAAVGLKVCFYQSTWWYFSDLEVFVVIVLVYVDYCYLGMCIAMWWLWTRLEYTVIICRRLRIGCLLSCLEGWKNELLWRVLSSLTPQRILWNRRYVF